MTHSYQDRMRFIRRVEEVVHPDYATSSNDSLMLIIEAHRQHIQSLKDYELTESQMIQVDWILKGLEK